MLIDCHLHTSRYSPCSRLEPATACSLALRRGLDALVITEHQLQWTAAEIRELQAAFPDLRLYSGLEITLEEGFDLVVITGGGGMELSVGCPLSRVLKALSTCREESFLFLAHAFRWTEERSASMERVLDHVDGLEMNSVNILGLPAAGGKGRYPARLEHLYTAVAEERRLVPLFNSDAHEGRAVGSLANRLEGVDPPEDEAALARLLKKSRPQEHQNPGLLRRLLA